MFVGSETQGDRPDRTRRPQRGLTSCDDAAARHSWA